MFLLDGIETEQKKLIRTNGIFVTVLCEVKFHFFHAQLTRSFSSIFVSLLRTESEICIPYKRKVIIL